MSLNPSAPLYYDGGRHSYYIALLQGLANPEHRAGTECLCLTNSWPNPFCHVPLLPPSDAKAISMASCTTPCQQPPGKRRWQRVRGC